MAHTTVTRVWGLVAGILILASLSGCASAAPTERIIAFSEAVDLVATNVRDSFEAVDRAYFDAEVVRTANSKQAVVQFDPARFSTWMPPEDVQVRIMLLDGLAAYAVALADVMTDDQLGAFDQSTMALGEQLESLTSTPEFDALVAKNHVSPEMRSSLTSAVNAIGRWFIEYRRHREVKSVIMGMNTHIESLCGFLSEDFDALRTQNAAAFDMHLTNLHGQLVSSYDAIDSPSRLRQVGELGQLVRRREAADRTLASAARSITRLAKTHADLHKAFDDDAIDLEASIRALLSEGRRIRQYYQFLLEGAE
ncbi:MAG: hypothetical protein KJZ69_01895 [Phycisphaerales bacterium]|nr:hypothetical protein [Phycisphaerales bacterium]